MYIAHVETSFLWILCLIVYFVSSADHVSVFSVRRLVQNVELTYSPTGYLIFSEVCKLVELYTRVFIGS